MVSFNCIDISIRNFGDNSYMVRFSVRLPVKEDDHSRIDALVIVGTIDFRAIDPFSLRFEPINPIRDEGEEGNLPRSSKTGLIATP
jgi:hypothetical protein